MIQAKRLWALVTFLVAAIAGTGWWLWPGLGASETYEIAESAFKDYAVYRGWPVEDFARPEKIEMTGSVVRLDWKSKTKSGCAIEVDVDRKFANARPSWSCH